MENMDWHKCRFLESSENLIPLLKTRFGREPSKSIAQEIVSCLQQGRLFYEAAEKSPLEIRPLQLFYGMVGFSKALIVAQRLESLSTLRHSHGISDISECNSRIAFLRLRIGRDGTFQEANDVVAKLTRVCYYDDLTNLHAIARPAATSKEMCGIELSLQDILSRIASLRSLYRMTFGQNARVEQFHISLKSFENGSKFRLEIIDDDQFNDRASLKKIVEGWRTRFPFLRAWKLESAQCSWGKSHINFENIKNQGVDEFYDKHVICVNGTYQADKFGAEGKRFSLEQGLHSVAGNLAGTPYAVSPVNGLYFSDFTYQYLALFLLSSLVRYRPQTWARSISQSSTSEKPADDKALSLIERFLDLNRTAVPEMVVRVLNPQEAAD